MTPQEINDRWGPDLVKRAVAELDGVPAPMERMVIAIKYFGRDAVHVLPWVSELASQFNEWRHDMRVDPDRIEWNVVEALMWAMCATCLAVALYLMLTPS